MPGPGQLKEMIRQLEHAENNLQALSQETVGSTGLDKVYRANRSELVPKKRLQDAIQAISTLEYEVQLKNDTIETLQKRAQQLNERLEQVTRQKTQLEEDAERQDDRTRGLLKKLHSADQRAMQVLGLEVDVQSKAGTIQQLEEQLGQENAQKKRLEEDVQLKNTRIQGLLERIDFATQKAMQVTGLERDVHRKAVIIGRMGAQLSGLTAQAAREGSPRI
ncbi:MAG: hypothetical protein M1813_009848 [Trichoglossum hirsutum]|nr:MAG: hypothetical protein M1813_009848 [Trichoglossum hirsutum]